MSDYDECDRRRSIRNRRFEKKVMNSSGICKDHGINVTEMTRVNVFFFVPNLIGYGRVVLTLTSFIIMIRYSECWAISMILYTSSFVGDFFDGIMARKLNQSSVFGSLLDMITDRCSTLGLLFVLYGDYGAPDREYYCFYRMLFMSMAILDISSHWCQMYSTALLHAHHKSKEGNSGHSFLVRWYYSNLSVFGYCCIATEFTYILLYLLYHADSAGEVLLYSFSIILKLCLPGFVIKQIINIFQLCSSCHAVASNETTIYNKTQ